MPRLIDTHAHLDSSIYERDLDNVVRRALDEDVWSITVGNDYRSSLRAVEIADRYPRGVYAAIGLHPTHVRSDANAEDKLLELEKFSELARDPKVVAIGEAGLDYRDLPVVRRRDPDWERIERTRENQKKVLGRFLQLSQETRLPLLLHCRDAHDDMLDILETHDRATSGFDSRGIVHAFTGTWKEAKRYFNLGFLVSMTGIIAYGGYQGEILRKMPLDRLALESDCPYLTASAWNLRRNEPCFIDTVADVAAGLRGTSKDALVTATTVNVLRTFTRIPR